MRTLTIALLLAHVGVAVIAQEEDPLKDLSWEEEDDMDDDSSEEDVDSPRGPILSLIAKDALKQMLQQLPCGWPEHGVPPLAPYRREEVNLALEKSFVKTITQMIRLRVDGLDNMRIKKFSVSYMNKKVKFHFIFRKLQATSGFTTDTLLDLMNELGISVRYEGHGELDLSLINLAIKGSFKFKVPLIYGSSKIYNFKAVVTLGGCRSNTNGLSPSAKINRMMNNKIESTIMSGINDNQAAISARIEEAIVPPVNEQLKGKTLWDLIAMKPDTPAEVCIPPPDPWA